MLSDRRRHPDDHFLKSSSRETRATQGRSGSDQRSPSRLSQARAGEKDARTYLLLGPWVHGVDSTGKTKSGEREFGPSASIDYDNLVLSWMDRYLKGIENGVEREKPVRYFVMGANQWRDSDVWPPPGRRTQFFLAPAASGERVGKLAAKPAGGAESFSEFVSDPANPVVNEYESSGR